MSTTEQYSWKEKLPSVELDICEENLDLFFKTMFERQVIWKKRFVDKLPAPWTKNKILRDFKFTNVYRELDRNSSWEIENIIRDKELSDVNLVWKIICFRLINNPDTFIYLQSKYKWKSGIPNIEDFNKKDFYHAVQSYRATGNNPFTNAYYINSTFSSNIGRDHAYCMVILPLFKKNIEDLMYLMKESETPYDVISYLTEFPSIAEFIAHELYQDFTYIKIYTGKDLFRWTRNDYTNVGPGAELGLRLIFPSLKKNKIEGIQDLLSIAESELYKIGSFPYINWSRKKEEYVLSAHSSLNLHSIEMWLCEFSKYWKMKIGEGKQRSKFKPKTNV